MSDTERNRLTRRLANSQLDFLSADDDAAWRIHRFLTKHLLHLQLGAKVLDVGCGIGVTVEYLRVQGILAYGIDIRDILPDRDYFVRSDANDTGFKEATFDAVTESLMFGQIEVIDKQPQRIPDILREISRVLKPDGHLMSYPGSGFLSITHLFPRYGLTTVNTPPDWGIGLAKKNSYFKM